MKADAITAKILEDARIQAAEMVKEAGDKAQAIRDKSLALMEEKRQESEKQADLQAAQLRDRMLRMAELDQKKALLAVKRQVIDQAFEDALKRMQQMTPDKKQEYMLGLLMESAQGGEQLIPCREDKALFDDAFMNKINQSLKEAGRAPVVLSQEARQLGGGFVLKQGGLEVNCAFKAVLQQARTALEAQVAGVLFN